MRKMDEMERSIQLHAEERGYRTALLSLSAWALFNCWKALAHGSEYSPLPALVLCLAVCVQGFSQMSMKRRMVVGDEEYRRHRARPVDRDLPPGKGLGRHEEHSEAAEEAGWAATGGHGEGAWREPPDNHRRRERQVQPHARACDEDRKAAGTSRRRDLLLGRPIIGLSFAPHAAGSSRAPVAARPPLRYARRERAAPAEGVGELLERRGVEPGEGDLPAPEKPAVTSYGHITSDPWDPSSLAGAASFQKSSTNIE